MHIGEESGINLGIFAAVILAAVLFGLAYNALVAWLERTGRDEGYTALLVVAGVGVTLGLSAFLIGLYPVLVVLAVFACTGTPMTIGSIYRHMEARRQAREKLQATLQEFRNGNPT